MKKYYKDKMIRKIEKSFDKSIVNEEAVKMFPKLYFDMIIAKESYLRFSSYLIERDFKEEEQYKEFVRDYFTIGSSVFDEKYKNIIVNTR